MFVFHARAALRVATTLYLGFYSEMPRTEADARKLTVTEGGGARRCKA